jgi:hypothetical protein
MFTRFGKIKTAAQSYLAQYKDKDPASYAAAQQAIGGILIVDGFIGIDNPLGGNKRSGVFGSLFGIALGIVFIFVPTIFNSVTGFDKMTASTSATIVSVDRSTDSDGGSSCTAVAQYTVKDQNYQQRSGYGSSEFCKLSPNSNVAINYDPNLPGSWSYNAHVTDNFLRIFQLAGVVVVISSFVTFIIRLLSIYFGWKILKSGRTLAKTLPGGTDISATISEIKRTFTQHLFGGTPPAAPAPTPAPQPLATPQPPVPPQPPQPPSSTTGPVS